MYDDAIHQLSAGAYHPAELLVSVSSISAPSITKKGCTKRAAVMLDRALYINAQDAESWYYAGLTQQKLNHLKESEPRSRHRRSALADE